MPAGARRSGEPVTGGNLMRLKSITASVAAFLLCAATTGCHVAGGCAGGACDAMPMGPVGCDSCGGGSCGGGGLLGKLGGLGGGGLFNGCGGLVGGCGPGGGGCVGGNCVTPESLTADGYGVRGGLTGPLAGLVGQHHRGPQSHMGGMPGPADGPPVAQVTYPYYTTRGPRDFFVDNPPSIGP